VIAVAVIPPVRADTFPGATPWNAVPAFWIIVSFHVLAATVLGFTAVRTTAVARPERPLSLGLLVPLEHERAQQALGHRTTERFARSLVQTLVALAVTSIMASG
jgi:hypothetical protein